VLIGTLLSSQTKEHITGGEIWITYLSLCCKNA